MVITLNCYTSLPLKYNGRKVVYINLMARMIVRLALIYDKDNITVFPYHGIVFHDQRGYPVTIQGNAREFPTM